jgi:hypothetical protein
VLSVGVCAHAASVLGRGRWRSFYRSNRAPLIDCRLAPGNHFSFP